MSVLSVDKSGKFVFSGGNGGGVGKVIGGEGITGMGGAQASYTFTRKG